MVEYLIEVCYQYGSPDKTHKLDKEQQMQKYVCDVCGYIYDPEEGDPDSGIEAGTSFEALPEDWVCPMCGAGKEDFSLEE